MDGTFSHEAFGWVEQMDATRRLECIGMDELNEKWGNANGYMDGWMDTRMHEWGGMGWDGYPNEWMAESPEAKTPNGRVCPMAGRQKRMPYGHGQRKGQKKKLRHRITHLLTNTRESE